MTPRRAFIVMIALPLLGAALGLGAGPFLARTNRVVQLAARLAHEDATGLTGRTLESDAFRDTGEPTQALFARAHAVRGRFLIGGAALGAFLGLVVALKVGAQVVEDPVDVYHIDHARCLACARCFRYCPREQVRRRRDSEQGTAVSSDTLAASEYE